MGKRIAIILWVSLFFVLFISIPRAGAVISPKQNGDGMLCPRPGIDWETLQKARIKKGQQKKGKTQVAPVTISDVVVEDGDCFYLRVRGENFEPRGKRIAVIEGVPCDSYQWQNNLIQLRVPNGSLAYGDQVYKFSIRENNKIVSNVYTTKLLIRLTLKQNYVAPGGVLELFTCMANDWGMFGPSPGDRVLRIGPAVVNKFEDWSMGRIKARVPGDIPGGGKKYPVYLMRGKNVVSETVNVLCY